VKSFEKQNVSDGPEMHTESCSALLKTLAIISLANLSFLAPGAAHDVWSDGTRVPAWVKRYCCGQEDVHRLSMRQIHHVEGGWRVDGYNRLIPDHRVLVSQDEYVWVFYRTGSDQSQSEVFCFFIPQGGSV
jgi:hypothetical protein